VGSSLCDWKVYIREVIPIPLSSSAFLFLFLFTFWIYSVNLKLLNISDSSIFLKENKNNL
jgi:hypothetical protein